MARLISIGLLAAAVLCACGQRADPPAPSPVPINLPALTQAYDEVAAGPDQQLAAFSAKLALDRTADEFRTSYAALADTLRNYRAGIMKMQFPASISADVKALITATAELEEIAVILARSSNPTGFADLTSEFRADLANLLKAENAVRFDLSLPPRNISGQAPWVAFTCFNVRTLSGTESSEKPRKFQEKTR